MNLVHKLSKWEHPRHNILVLVFRVILGIVITFKGIIFLSDIELLNILLRHSGLRSFHETFWTWYIALTSIFCGVFIITGLFTRIVAAIQVPVLVGAVLFVNPGEQSFTLNGELLLSVFILTMLVYFLIKGGGEVSMDNYLRSHKL